MATLLIHSIDINYARDAAFPFRTELCDGYCNLAICIYLRGIAIPQRAVRIAIDDGEVLLVRASDGARALS